MANHPPKGAAPDPSGDRLKSLRYLRRLRDIYLVAQALVVAIVLYGFYWSATEGPLAETVFRSFFNLFGFIVLVIFTPGLIIRAFPRPFPQRPPGVSMREALQSERIKVSLAVLAAGLLANQIIFAPRQENVQHVIGYLVIAVSLLVAGWVLRDERMGVFWNFWRSAKGEGKGQGWENFKAVFHWEYWDLEPDESAGSVRLEQDRAEEEQIRADSQ